MVRRRWPLAPAAVSGKTLQNKKAVGTKRPLDTDACNFFFFPFVLFRCSPFRGLLLRFCALALGAAASGMHAVCFFLVPQPYIALCCECVSGKDSGECRGHAGPEKLNPSCPIYGCMYSYRSIAHCQDERGVSSVVTGALDRAFNYERTRLDRVFNYERTRLDLGFVDTPLFLQ